MIQTIAKVENQHFIKRSLSWEQFKVLQSAFNEIGGVRLIYCEGELEIMGIGRLHEMICTLLGALLISYFTLKRIRFTSTGAYTQSVRGRTEFQSDLSYNFDSLDITLDIDREKEISDLCIEVVMTSGDVTKLKKYQLLAVPEVWFWEDGKISIYCLQDGDYKQVQSSLCLPDLDIYHLEQCLLMDSQLNAMLALAERYK